MKETWRHRWRTYPVRSRWLLGTISASGLALLGAHSPLVDSVQSSWLNLSFDGERVGLLTNLTMAILGATCAAFLLRNRAATWAGGTFFFLMTYLVPFLWQSLQPASDALGRPQAVVSAALWGVTVTLVALAVVGCGIGAAVGAALGELLVPSLAKAARVGYHLWRGEQPPVSRAQLLGHGMQVSGGVAVLLAAWLCLQNAGNLLTYGPSTPIFRPIIPAAQRSQAHGTVQHSLYRSPILGNRMQPYWLYLPPSYEAMPQQRYPVIYLLHGSPGDASEWFHVAHVADAADALIARHQMREALLVSASGNGPYYRFSEWANSADGRQRMEDAIAYDLVRLIDQRYRTRTTAADRAIGGLSMGGFGAVNIALHHPDVFGTALSLGGYFTAEGALFGTQSTYRALNSPALFIQTAQGLAALRQLRFIIGVGRADGTYYRQGIAFAQALQQAQVPVTVLVAAGGHAWRVWARQMAQAFPLLEPT